MWDKFPTLSLSLSIPFVVILMDACNVCCCCCCAKTTIKNDDDMTCQMMMMMMVKRWCSKYVLKIKTKTLSRNKMEIKKKEKKTWTAFLTSSHHHQRCYNNSSSVVQNLFVGGWRNNITVHLSRILVCVNSKMEFISNDDDQNSILIFFILFQT